ncbi:hypothetical protein [Penaeicola halotolerans]|uniref:hypothetical protein n=1 Tax=Penaeicola halotolerans TaxID=2793196 RepID=UPI001CF84B49|nr:hypothetical protein [Penaeicola halotolerans]
MPKQKGIFKIQGSLDEVNFYKSKDGFLARLKGGVSKERIQSDPRFKRTRENMAEFEHASKSAKLFLSAFSTSIDSVKDPRMNNRLFSIMSAIIRSNPDGIPGLRKVSEGDLTLLRNFEFNSAARLENILKVQAAITSTESAITVAFASINPERELVIPPNVTHFRIVCACGAVDFAANETSKIEAQSDYFSILDIKEDLSMNLDITGLEAYDKYVALGVEFVKEVGGRYYQFMNGSFNALTVVQHLPHA